MTNQQENPDSGLTLPLVEQFYSIQGEGFHAGKPACFIRIGGCDIGCKWCDTKFSWNKDLHMSETVENIVARIIETPARALVVTGGEPLMYNLQPLTDECKKYGIETFLETCGNHKLTGSWNWICLSPKKTNPPTEKNFSNANELKVIIDASLDFDWAEINAKKVGPDCKLFLQPEWSKFKILIPEVVNYVKLNPQWNISLQIHKFMRIP